jgi:CRISPR-associated protein Csb2
MTAIELRFPAGRFHATPWGRHVNEGAVEWPPSPWRILRALIATWHLKAKDNIPESALRALVARLVAKCPSYRLPKASLGHTRHYMPYLEGKNQKTTKVFDTFVQVAAEEPVQVAWDIELSPPEMETLRLLTERLGYFGRAESLAEGRILTDGISCFEPNVAPLRDEAPLSPDYEIVRLLAPMPNEEFVAWRADFLARREGATPGRGRGRGKSNAPAFPIDVFEALLADTNNLQAAGWNVPPGSRHLTYARSVHAFDIAPTPTLRRGAKPPTVARYAIASAVLPRITQAVSVAERIHQSLCKFSDGARVFLGKDEAGQPLTGHRHAHVWCEALGERDAITHVTVNATDGFDERAARALRRLQKVWGHGGHDLQLILLGLGEPADFEACYLFRSSTVWQSFTPFIPTHHAKTYRDGRPKLDQGGWQIGSPEHDLRRLLPIEKFQLLTKMDRMKMASINGRSVGWIQFKTARNNGNGRRAESFGCGFRLTFSKPVGGPITVGYGAHFGLGLFVPV